MKDFCNMDLWELWESYIYSRTDQDELNPIPDRILLEKIVRDIEFMKMRIREENPHY